MAIAELICYKKMPVWTASVIPKTFLQTHNTKAGTWAQLNIIQGSLKFAYTDEAGALQQTFEFDVQNQPHRIAPQQWHRLVECSLDLQCQLHFLCEPKDYFAKKYDLSPTHSELLALLPLLPKRGLALDIGCGRGRNSLALAQRGWYVHAWDHNDKVLNQLKAIAKEEDLHTISACNVDLEEAQITERYDFICALVVLMFLSPKAVQSLIVQMQNATLEGGCNLIVSAMDTDDCPSPLPFSAPFKTGELKAYYDNWEILKYNEDFGLLGRTDAQGNRIRARFATILARKHKLRT